MVGHPRPALGAEVLHDHLAEMAVLVAEVAQCEQRLQPLRARLSDPDQDPARERDRELARQPDRLETRCGQLVGRGPVWPTALGEPPGQRLEHDPHRGRDRPQELELGTRHHTRVQVRQQTGLLEHGMRAVREVLDRRAEAQGGELVAGNPVAMLGLVAEREERLGAAGGGAGARDLEHLLHRQVGPLAPARRPRERAVAADVAAQRRQRNEDLRRVGDERATPEPPRLGHEVGQGRGDDLGDEGCHR